MGSARKGPIGRAKTVERTDLDDLLNAMPDCVFVLDASWRFVFANALAVEELGAGDLLGTVIWNTFPGSVGSAFELSYRRAVKTKTAQTFEAFFEPLASWYEVRAVPLDRRLVVFFRNITERRNRARLVEERSGTLTDLTEQAKAQARIAELQSELIHALRVTATGTMASALAHELNQPLAASSAYLGAARHLLGGLEGDAAEHAREAATKAADQILRAGEIIRRLRRMVERREVELKPVALRPLVGEALVVALPKERLAEVSVAIQVPPEIEVLADAVQIQQVLLNLYRNAVEAMEGCPIRELIVSAYVEGDEAIVRVADSGPGVPREQREKLFTPFATTKEEGLGVGLSISRTIIEAHGGRMWVEDRSRGGAVFCFSLRTA